MFFADDSSLLVAGQTPQQAVEAAADIVISDFRQTKELNELLLNEAKTQNIVCTLKSRGQEVHEENTVKLLGFAVDQKVIIWGAPCLESRQEVVLGG